MKTLLAPLDFSAVTPRIVAEATALARALDGRVVLLHVTQPVVVVADPTGFGRDTAELNKLNAEAAAIKLSRIEDALEAEFTNADTILLTGSPVKVILEQAKKLRADYIVIGSHGHSAFYDLVVGSTTRAVLKRAGCPVIVVPSQGAKRVAHAVHSSAEAPPTTTPVP